jgi:hypothetical protein
MLTVSCLALLVGCGGKDGASATGGANGRGGAGPGPGSGGVGGNGGAVPGKAGASGQGGRDAGTDCFPPCIAALRASCGRPLVDAGSCGSLTTAGVPEVTYCYSNGVNEIQSPVDGGLGLVVITEPDGKTPCYQVFVDSTGLEHYQTNAGQEVAQLMVNSDGSYSVTCGGTITVVEDRTRSVEC